MRQDHEWLGATTEEQLETFIALENDDISMIEQTRIQANFIVRGEFEGKREL
jgi:hypothetical protein